MVEHLGDAGAVLVVDETGFLKKGKKSVGVQRQYSGTAGRMRTVRSACSWRMRAPPGAPSWTGSCTCPRGGPTTGRGGEEAGVPREVDFRTKPQLAKAMLERALAVGVPAAWVTGDEIYGGDRRLRLWLEERDVPHVLAVSCHHPVWQAGTQERADRLIAALPPEAWGPLSAGTGSQGERLYDWACVRLPYESAPGHGPSGCGPGAV